MRQGRKMSLILGIILLLGALGIGYAYINTTLSIDGTTEVDSANWNIYFDNIKTEYGSVSGDQVTQAPTIDTNKTKVSFHVRLKEPGEYYGFEVDAVNEGTIDAMIESIVVKINGEEDFDIPAYLKFYMAYADETSIAPYQLLKAGTRETYVFSLLYMDFDSSVLPDENQEYNIEVDINYVQATNMAQPLRTTKYTTTTSSETIGNEIPSNVTHVDTYEEAIEGKAPVFLKDVITFDNVLKSSDVGFILNDNLYYLKGSETKYNLLTGEDQKTIYFEDNKQVLLEAFGASKCDSGGANGSSSYLHCYDSGIEAQVDDQGLVWISYDSNGGCKVTESRTAICFINQLPCTGPDCVS